MTEADRLLNAFFFGFCGWDGMKHEMYQLTKFSLNNSNNSLYLRISRESLLRRGGILWVDLCEHGGELGLVLVRPLPEPLVEYTELALEHARTLAGIAFGY